MIHIRDVVIIPLTSDEELVISTDCSGSVGEKENDFVNVPYDILGYYTARVALMELMSVRAVPISYTLSNFTTNGFDKVHIGIKKALNEVGIHEITSISSSETNFDCLQSAIGISFIGKRKKVKKSNNELKFAVLGYPLVGDEVINNPDKVVSLELFSKLLEDERILDILPVGSKGIKYEVQNVLGYSIKNCNVDINKSAGPSTCVIIGYLEKNSLDLSKDYSDLINFID